MAHSRVFLVDRRLKVNLWDNNFADQPCSVWNQTSQHITYVRNQMKWDGITLFTDAWCLNPIVDEVESPIKIAWLHEPACLWPTNYDGIRDVAHKFDKVLTYYQPLLDLGDPYIFCPYGGVWLPREQWGLKPKTKNISMLIGSKMSTEGHRLRHEVYHALVDAGLGDKVDFYGVYGEPVDYSWQTKYKVLADYRYSIVIEACREDNLFTEILLDCFALGTIPIFWGAPNIRKFFDWMGIVQIGGWTPTDFASQLLWLTRNGPDIGFLAGIEENLKRVADYAVTEDWMAIHILKELV